MDTEIMPGARKPLVSRLAKPRHRRLDMLRPPRRINQPDLVLRLGIAGLSARKQILVWFFGHRFSLDITPAVGHPVSMDRRRQPRVLKPPPSRGTLLRR
jgi:hypothetical protein